MRILVVEDNKKVAGFIVKGLREESYAVDHAADGNEARTMALHTEYDAIILDLMLPGISGMEVLRSMRIAGIRAPVLILTARSSIGDKVEGLDAGADDYLTKPFSFDELLARLRALLRRGTDAVDNTLKLEDLSVDCVTREVCRGKDRVDLTAKEFALLVFLLRNEGRIMTRTSIIDHVWDMQYDSETNIVDVLVRYLRRKIDDDHPRKLIHTVRGVGYVMKSDEA
ncbi:MAG: DNA-binding response regulator [Verrucomicrobia bacterium]|nr:DNA-binding response regulator [Verrucomicrobiota bacterium]